MSFGFSIGDFIAVAELAWKLHQDCYKVLHDCPQEIKDLSRDLATVYGVLKHIQADLDSSDSSIKAHGEHREKLLQTMVTNLDKTLKGLQQLVSSFQSLALDSRRRDQFLLKIKYLISQKKINRIHQEISFHISSFNLMLASIGNSSLQRIESGMQQMRLLAQSQQQATEPSKNEFRPLDGRDTSPTEPSTTEFEPPHELETDTNTENSSVPLSHLTCEPQVSLWPTPAVIKINIVRLASLSFLQQEAIVKIVLENCEASCFGFYVTNSLWRTKFSYKDLPTQLKLFDREDGSSAKHYTDFTLIEWIAKIRIALYDGDSCSWASISRDPAEFQNIMRKADRIPSIKIPWGGLNVDYCEEAINSAVDLCDLLKDWDSVARLKGLLVKIRYSSSDIDLTHLYPEITARGLPTNIPSLSNEAKQSKKRSLKEVEDIAKRSRN